MNKTWIEAKADDGSLIKIRASEVNLIQLPSRFAPSAPGQPLMCQILIGNFLLNAPHFIGEAVNKMLDELDGEKEQNLLELNGKGPARN